jgi:anti-anti-sigma factor
MATVTRTDDADGTRLHLRGSLDVQTVTELHPLVEEILGTGAKLVVVDCAGLDLLDSSGMGAIIALYKRLRALGGELQLLGVRDQPLTIFRQLRLDRIFHLDAALQRSAANQGSNTKPA